MSNEKAVYTKPVTKLDLLKMSEWDFDNLVKLVAEEKKERAARARKEARAEARAYNAEWEATH